MKLASIMNIPLERIIEADSEDLVSVSSFYSGELVKFVKQVL
jgi:WASH complex subunit strumpellin